jgi:hypothetical protein
MLRSHLRHMARQVAQLESRLAPAPPEELNPFMDHDVVAAVQQGAAKLRAHLSRLAERWQSTPEDFVPWERRSVIEKLVTAATPEQAEEASRLLQLTREKSRLAKSAFFRRREEQYSAAYQWQRRLQFAAGPARAQAGDRGDEADTRGRGQPVRQPSTRGRKAVPSDD